MKSVVHEYVLTQLNDSLAISDICLVCRKKVGEQNHIQIHTKKETNSEFLRMESDTVANFIRNESI